MTISLIDRVQVGSVLSRADAETLMTEVLEGRIETPELVRLLVALNQRPMHVQELTGFAAVMRRHAAPVFAKDEALPTNMVDTCGTGGDGCRTFNISTAAAIVAAAAGARVAKHGNRAASSQCGSADVLEELGVRIDMPLEQTGRAIREIGIGFLFAPMAHTAMRHATAARKQIAARTVFNLLGPLTNPARAQSQVLGVFSPEVIAPVAETLAELGVRRAFVVHGVGGLDEISTIGETMVAEVANSSIKSYTVTPEDFGVARASLENLRGGSAKENALLIRDIFSGHPGPGRDVVAVNAAAALVASGISANLREGMQLANAALSSGTAEEKLSSLVAFRKTESVRKTDS